MIKLAVIVFALPIILLASDRQGPFVNSSCGSPTANKTVIVIHGGGYAIGSPSEVIDSCQQFAEAGFYVINLAYPLKDLAGAELALRKTTAEADRRPGPLYLYGESAGGGLAALAAARGWTDGAFAWAPPTDLRRWRQDHPGDSLVEWSVFKSTKPTLLRRLSAATWVSSSSAPLYIVHGRADQVVSPQQTRRLAKRWPGIKVDWANGGHDSNEISHQTATSKALACFEGLTCSWAN